MYAYLLLALAIIAEVFATIALKSADGFSKLGPSIVVVVGYVISFGALGYALKLGLPLNVGYAIWSAVGTSIVAIAGVMLYKEKLGVYGFIGIALIILGVVFLHINPAGSNSVA